MKPTDEFYLQDSRSYVGNDVLWWAKGGGGYTTDLSKAEVFTLAQAQWLHEARCSDIPWPKDYIDARTRPAVDMQYIKRDEAIPGSGIKLVKPPKQKPDQLRCEGCGRVMSMVQFYSGNCENCGMDNRP